MKSINWTVRVKNKAFWVAVIPAVLLLAQSVAAAFGYEADFLGLEGRLLDLVNAAFALFATLGVVTDPTTAGICDSQQAMGYTEPK